ncbi:glycosyltransferase involved in cell wall biosynthesis [Microbacterium trichothecenolyticum]|uniref:glycosyltransferase n=1 Tax=Microbacterium trichothecenolyticum TaxID=69370 RepID=UPI002864A137|nr:glycosyltransferase [Microbacterium trichothecenolyticum]MDR7185084.1 glycosyltransferase involved in cell wall biosynthesis [Microbacterium trichothecenolyticum]
MGVHTAMDDVLDAPTIVKALLAADDLAFEAGRDPSVRTLRVLATALAGNDDIAGIAAVHALAEIHDDEAQRQLVGLLSDERPFIREHAAWALGQSLPRPEAVGRLLALVAAGGFTGMLAQHTIERWSSHASDAIAIGIEAALLGITDAAPRAALVETLGLVSQPVAARLLREIASDPTEHDAVRATAIAALGQRRDTAGLEEELGALLATGGPLAPIARLALIDLDPIPGASTAPPAFRPSRPYRTPRALTVAQLFLHADIDPALSAAGAGDNGGIATLLVRLGDALTATDDSPVTRVLTLSRGRLGQSTVDLLQLAGTPTGHLYGHIALPDEPVASAAAWPYRVAARRGIRRILRAAGDVDVLHLRMADVGSLAAADVARELGIPTIFTVAPDPHSVIQSLQDSGALTRARFGEADLREHFWFRVRLVKELAASASHTVFFPRPNLVDEMRELVGIDMTSRSERHTVVAEGVDLAVTDRAVVQARAAAGPAAATPPHDAFAELEALLGSLDPDRRGRPLLVSVGRLHRLKGMASLVETWAGSPLADRANLLIIGGDLENPSRDEQGELDRIAALVPPHERARRGLILPGHRPNDVAARWMATARFGMPRLAAVGGVYVCASLKEEFGLAVLEAMATGLVVVAPDGGGPATYVDHGDTGFLTATWDADRLAGAIASALDRAADADELRAVRARDVVASKFTIQAMAATLAPIYASVVAQEAEFAQPTRLPA